MSKTPVLTAPREDHPLADLQRCLAGTIAGDLPEFDRRHFHVQVNAIQQRA